MDLMLAWDLIRYLTFSRSFGADAVLPDVGVEQGISYQLRYMRIGIGCETNYNFMSVNRYVELLWGLVLSLVNHKVTSFP